MLNGEKIRLVVWDLDETFWSGTLTEGGIREYVRAHHDIVIELAQRGIISSICSKNEVAPVEAVLRENGLWDYFVFPSIDWSAKGPRLKQLVEDIQLRPETVLFIDDNASNRAEAAKHVPGLQIADETIIGDLLAHDLLKGKPDAELSRLKQYQLLQRRKADEKSAGADNKAFLRNSNIRVLIDPDIEANLDRAIELVNRTNQLNFTKLRLPDDKAAAAEELLKITRDYSHQAGLIRVWDDYGDHGICGFYVVTTHVFGKYLLHFCFSCRVLGMGVEQWVYEKLGRPNVKISGEVVSDLGDGSHIDWINRDAGGALIFADGFANAPPPSFSGLSAVALAPEIRLHGSCELEALSHYLQQEAPKLVQSNSTIVGAFHVRRDETSNFGLFTRGMTDEIRNELDSFELFDRNYDQGFFGETVPGTLFVLSTWGDVYLPLYRHTRLGFDINVTIWRGLRRRPEFAVSGTPDPLDGIWNLTRVTEAELQNVFEQYGLRQDQEEQIKRIVRHLRENYEFVGSVNYNMMARNLDAILQRIPSDCHAAILLPNFQRKENPMHVQTLHYMTMRVLKHFPNAFAIDPAIYILSESDQQNTADHLDRMVYYKMYKEIIDRVAQAQIVPMVAAE